MESTLGWILQSVDHPIHFFAEIVLVILLFYIYSTKSYKPVDESLTQMEEEELIAEWKPEPLVSADRVADANKQIIPKVIDGASGPHVTVEGQDYLNFACNGFLGYQKHPATIQAAIECTNKYGVGACGPRGFYGSIAPHMELEKRVAKFLGTEDSVLFSSEFQTIASVIPAFAKPGDYLICDKGVSFAIQNGIILSRSIIKWFDHNDTHDLQRILQSLTEVFQRAKHRVFLLIEAIYVNHGDMAPLKEIVDLKRKYPFRIILEESLSIGVLGKTGRGIMEHLGIPSDKVEVICSSIGNALGAVGGFATGTGAMGNHMRLNCNGYVFSCSLPPYISAATCAAIDLLESSGEIKQLQQNVQHLHACIKSNRSFSKFFTVPSSDKSPYVLLRLKTPKGKEADQETLQSIVDELYNAKMITTVLKCSKRELFPPEPSLKFSIMVGHTKKELSALVETLVTIAERRIKLK